MLGASVIGITNFCLFPTFVVDYRNFIFMMRKFSSDKFNLDILQDEYFPQNVPVTALYHTYARDNLEDSIENCVEFINDHGGFTVVMRYSRGEINGK